MPSPKSGISTRDTVTGLETFGRVGTSNHTRDRGTESRGSRRCDSGQRGPDRGGLHPPVLRTCGCVTGLAPRSRRMVPRVLPTKEYIRVSPRQGWMTYSSPPWSMCETRLTVVSSELCVERRFVRGLTLAPGRRSVAVGLTRRGCHIAVSTAARYPARPGRGVVPRLLGDRSW